MKTKIQNGETALALRIPKSFADSTQIKEGSEIKLSLEEDKIIISKNVKPGYTLKDLLLKVNRDNIPTEISFGLPKGKELI